MLKIRCNNRQQDPFWIMERNYSIGSAEDNHLVLHSDTIAPHHIKIIRDTDNISLKELDTNYKTLVNGRSVFKNRPLSCGDVITIGDTELEIIDPLNEQQEATYWSLIGDSSWLSGQEFILPFEQKKRLLLGRGKHCDIVFPGTHLSREHAAIYMDQGNVVLEDLKSANATFVNDERISKAQINAGDRVRFDVYSFRVFGPGIKLHQSATRKFNSLAKELELQSKSRPAPAKRKTAPKSIEQRLKQRQSAVMALKNNQLISVKRTPVTNWLLALLLITFIVSITAHVLFGSSL